MSNINTLLTVSEAKNRFEFVAKYVTAMTAKKANRTLVNDYQVKKVNNLFLILFGGKECGYQPMTAESLYSWLVRTPLNYFAIEAENLRYDILTV